MCVIVWCTMMSNLASCLSLFGTLFKVVVIHKERLHMVAHNGFFSCTDPQSLAKALFTEENLPVSYLEKRRGRAVEPANFEIPNAKCGVML